MITIEIDFDVYKKLTVRRESEEVSYNDVIRDLLKMSPKKSDEVLLNKLEKRPYQGHEREY